MIGLLLLCGASTAILQQSNDSEATFFSAIFELVNNEKADLLHIYSWFPPMHNSKVENSVVINLKKDFEIAEGLWQFNFYLMFLEGKEDLLRFIEMFNLSTAWNPRARFLVVLHTRQDLNDFFELAWQHFLIYFTIIIEETSEAFTFFPKTRAEDCDYMETRTVCKFPCDITTLFPFKRVTTNYLGCPVRVICMFRSPFVINVTDEAFPGFEILLLKVQAEELNFTIDYVNHNYHLWGHKTSFGNYTELLSVLFSDTGNVMIGLMPINASYGNDFDYIGYYFEYAAFFVPAARLIEPWKNLTWVFDGSVWLCIILTWVVVSLAFWVIDDDKSVAMLINWFFNVLCMLISSFSSKPKSWLMRALFAWWTTYAYILTSTYQGSLITFLTKPAMEHQISTLQELADSDLSYGGIELGRSFFNIPDSKLYTKIYRNYKYCFGGEICDDRMAFQRDFAMVHSTRIMEFDIQRKYTAPDGSRMVHVLKPAINTVYEGILLSKGFPLFEKMADVTSAMVESGFVSKWQEEQQKASAKYFQADPSSPFTILTVSHFKLLFIVLLVGYSAAFLAFLIEIFLGKYRNRNCRQAIGCTK